MSREACGELMNVCERCRATGNRFLFSPKAEYNTNLYLIGISLSQKDIHEKYGKNEEAHLVTLISIPCVLETTVLGLTLRIWSANYAPVCLCNLNILRLEHTQQYPACGTEAAIYSPLRFLFYSP